MTTKLPLSVAVVTFNEEKNLPACLDSVASLAKEIVVVDSFSTDGTVECAKRYGARVEQRPWPGFISQKNFAFNLCTQEWILGIDADERLSPELQETLRQAIKQADASVAGFEINRKSYYMGRWIEHSWYPDWIVRVGRRGKVMWEGHDPHDRLSVTGQLRRLHGALYHFPYPTLQAHLERTIKYARCGAEYLAGKGVHARCYHLLFHPLGAFLKKIVFKGAWLDGLPGVIIAFSSLIGGFAKYAYLWEIQRTKANREDQKDSERQNEN